MNIKIRELGEVILFASSAIVFITKVSNEGLVTTLQAAGFVGVFIGFALCGLAYWVGTKEEVSARAENEELKKELEAFKTRTQENNKRILAGVNRLKSRILEMEQKLECSAAYIAELEDRRLSQTERVQVANRA